MKEIYNAEDRTHAEKAIEAFKNTYGWCPWSARAPASRTASWSSVRRPPPDHRPKTSVASGRSCRSLAE
jgi:hypothetical protein